MSADHKRPLLAFVLVGVMCALIIVGDIRSEAVSRLLRPIGQPVAAGLELVHERAWPRHSAPAPEAAPAVVDPGSADVPVAPAQASGTPSAAATPPGSHQGAAGPTHVVHAGPATAQGHHAGPGQVTPAPEQGSPAQDGTSGNQGHHAGADHGHGAPGLVQHAADAVGNAVQSLSTGLLPGQGLHLGRTVAGEHAAAPALGHGPWTGQTTGAGHGHAAGPHRAARHERVHHRIHQHARGHHHAGRHHGHGWAHDH